MSTRGYAIGDPQTTLSHLQAILDANGLLAGGRLRPDAHLVSLGDHFDFAPPAGMTMAQAGEEGLALLRWLAEHPNVTLLFGNHDVSRVMELHDLSDADFRLAQEEAQQLPAAAWRERYPHLAPQNLFARDFGTFSEAQRRIVQELLLSGRMRLATAAALEDGTPVLLSHAGVTQRELDLLGIPRERDPAAIAEALNGFLDACVGEVRDAWEAGSSAPLDLSPLHDAGAAGTEGGGMLYHRPARHPPAEDGLRRRFHPSQLPAGLVQACGHTQPHKMEELGFEGSRPCKIHWLAVTGSAITYTLDRPGSGKRQAVLAMLDGGLHRAAPGEVELLPIAL